jgi:hypothetical protein
MLMWRQGGVVDDVTWAPAGARRGGARNCPDLGAARADPLLLLWSSMRHSRTCADDRGFFTSSTPRIDEAVEDSSAVCEPPWSSSAITGGQSRASDAERAAPFLGMFDDQPRRLVLPDLSDPRPPGLRPQPTLPDGPRVPDLAELLDGRRGAKPPPANLPPPRAGETVERAVPLRPGERTVKLPPLRFDENAIAKGVHDGVKGLGNHKLRAPTLEDVVPLVGLPRALESVFADRDAEKTNKYIEQERDKGHVLYNEDLPNGPPKEPGFLDKAKALYKRVSGWFKSDEKPAPAPPPAPSVAPPAPAPAPAPKPSPPPVEDQGPPTLEMDHPEAGGSPRI